MSGQTATKPLHVPISTETLPLPAVAGPSALAAPPRRRLRVALLVTAVDFGGIEKVVLTQLRHMDRDIEVVPLIFTRSDRRSWSFFDQLQSLGITVRTLYVDRNRLLILNPLRNIVETVRALRHEHIDLIHSHGYRADILALPIARYLGVPVVSTCHGFTSIDRRLSMYARLNVMMLRGFTRVIAVSASMRDDLVGLRLDSGRVSLVTNAVEEVDSSTLKVERHQVRERLRLDDGEIVFGFVGRLSDEKGVHHLVDALAAGAPALPWRLLVVGEGPRRQELEQRVASQGLSERIHFSGFQSDASPWYAAMDVFVLPSLTEGTPMALLEAMIRRLPVVATSVGGVPAVVSDRINGLLVPPANPAAMSAALCEMAANSELRDRLAQAGRDTVRTRYDVGNWISSIRGVYEQALESARA
jgi:glycosyltransferase involved in cell wall biosynthesis